MGECRTTVVIQGVESTGEAPGLDTLSGDAVFRCASSLDALREVLADGGDRAGYVVATVDVESVAHARGRIPSLDHDRRFSAPEPAGRKPRAAA